MKLKYLQGGSFIPPFAVYLPFMIPTADESSGNGKKSSGSGDKGIDMKDVYDLIKDLDGLPGDASHVTNLMNSLLSNIEYKLSNPMMFGGTSSITAEYMQLLNLTSNLKFQRERYNKAYDNAVANGSIHEAAINSKGLVMVLTKEGPEWVTPEQYAKNPEDYHVVTNLELLNFRALGQGGLSFDLDSITTVSNGMGIEAVTKLILDSIQNLGNISSNINSGYVGMKTGDLLLGLLDYQTALQKSGRYDASILDLYEVKLLTESLADLAKLALQYIYHTLPATAKSLLKMKSNGKDSGAEALIGTLITSKLKYKTDFDPNLVGGPSAKKSGKTGSEGTADDKSNPYLLLIREEGGLPRTFTIVPEDTNNGLQVTGTFYSALPKVNEEMSIDALLATGMLPITGNSRKSISFGDLLLDSSQLKDVMFDNEGGAVMTLPTITDQLGNVRVNMAIVEDFNKVLNELKKYKNLPEHEYNKKYAELLKKYELDELIDFTTGLPDLSRTALFLVIGAYTTDKIDFNKKSKFIKKVKNPTEDLEKRLIKGLSTNKDKNDYVIDVDDHWGFIEGFWDDIYRANVFIPLNQNPNAAVNALGDLRSETSVTAAEQMYLSFNKFKNMKPTYEVE